MKTGGWRGARGARPGGAGAAWRRGTLAVGGLGLAGALLLAGMTHDGRVSPDQVTPIASGYRSSSESSR